MENPPQRTHFEAGYRDGTPPWVIGEPQPAIVELERAGWITGPVLDAGAGAGEHTIYLAARGYQVSGIDFAESAVALAKSNAAERGVEVEFTVADALEFTGPPRFETIVDSALFHVFDAENQDRYAKSMHEVCQPGGVLHLLALAEHEPPFGPQVSEQDIRTAFADDWSVESIAPSSYRGIATEERAAELGLTPGVVDVPAWLARIRRL